MSMMSQDFVKVLVGSLFSFVISLISSGIGTLAVAYDISFIGYFILPLIFLVINSVFLLFLRNKNYRLGLSFGYLFILIPIAFGYLLAFFLSFGGGFF